MVLYIVSGLLLLSEFRTMLLFSTFLHVFNFMQLKLVYIIGIPVHCINVL